MKILGMIPARGGSKGIPNKNIKPLCGKSLIQRSYECAVASKVIDRLILSTDDNAIAEAGRTLGLEVPFLRPRQFASDQSPMIDVAIHAITEMQKVGYQADALLLLQPTSPLRKPEHISEAIQVLESSDSVCSIVPVQKDLCPHYLMQITSDGYLRFFMPDGSRYTRRQDVPQAYKRDGTIFLTRINVITHERSFYGKRCMPLFINPIDSLNIDSLEDWACAERRLGGITD